jgi:hypothetical protein
MMGYLIRHIHNRDLATENIMTAYVRLRFILKKFPKTIKKMVTKFELTDLRIPRGGSTLELATEVVPSPVDIFTCMSTCMSLHINMFYVMSQVMEIKGALPGQYACAVRPSRRNSFNHRLHLDTELVKQLRILGRRLEPQFNLEFDTACLEMNAGVMLNGRKYRQGDRCRFPLHSWPDLDTILHGVDMHVDMSTYNYIMSTCNYIMSTCMSTCRHLCRHVCSYVDMFLCMSTCMSIGASICREWPDGGTRPGSADWPAPPCLTRSVPSRCSTTSTSTATKPPSSTSSTT